MISRVQLGAKGGAVPPPIRALMSGHLSLGEFRANRPLPEDAQKIIDDAVVRVGLDRLVIVSDLISAGLTFPVPDAWGTMLVQWDEISKAGGATRSMNPNARGEKSLVERRPRQVPLWVTFDDFDLGIRTLAASQRVGMPLDTTMVEEATRRVNEAIEDSVINGIDINVFGTATYGLLNAPNANTYTYLGAGATNWDASAKTGQEILTDVLNMIALAHAAKRYGPYNLYVPTAYDIALNKNFSTEYQQTIRARLEQIQAGGRGLVIRCADQLPANRTVLVQMTREVIDLVDGMQPEVLTWEEQGGMVLNWMVAAIQVPRVKTDFADASGIVTGNV